MEENINVAIVGLGRVGSRFIEKISQYDGKGVKIVAAAEKNQNAPGIEIAERKYIKVFSDEKDILALGNDVDIVFDLTGDKRVERGMRLAQVREGNTHTVIVPTVVAQLIWKMISEGSLPFHTNPVQDI